jgi:hypothetical protein
VIGLLRSRCVSGCEAAGWLRRNVTRAPKAATMSNRRLQGAGGRICSPSANMLMAMADPVLSFCLPLVGPVVSATRLGDSDRHHGRGACRVARRRRQVPPRRKTTFCRFEGAPNASRDDLGFVGPIPGVSPPPTEERNG